MQETLIILRRGECDTFDDYVAFKCAPALYWGCLSSDMSGLALSVAWHVGHRSNKNKDYSYQLLFPEDVTVLEIPEKIRNRNSILHAFTEEEKASFMKMFDIHYKDFLENVANWEKSSWRWS